MVPTFFGISVIIFAVLNFAPGHPGETKLASDLSANVRGEKSQETYRIFREQFNLDKPVLYNILFALREDTVASALRALIDPAANDAQKIKAQNRLQDFGQFAVPHLIHIMQTADSPMLRDIAVYFLRLDARQRLINPFAKDPDPETRERNRAIDAENATIRTWRYALDDPDEQKQEVIAQWTHWYDEHRSRWEYTAKDKVRLFLFDTRFAAYWANLARLDFGVSMVTREPVVQTLFSKLKYSISLSITSILLAYLISIPLGIYSAIDKDSALDRTTTVILFMLYSLPSFFVAALLLYWFSQSSDYPALRWFPIGGWRSSNYMNLTALEQIRDVGWHLALPVACLTYGSFAVLSRYMRTGLLDVIRSDYIRTARAKGLPEWQVVLKHALRNGLLPILTLLAELLPAVLGGSVIIESIFGIPGMGKWMIDSIYQRDYNVIMAVELLTTVLVLVGILLSDLSYALVDPRITYK